MVLVTAGVMGLLHAAVEQPESAAGKTTSATAAAKSPEFKPVDESMHEFMEYVFQPTYRRLKSSMANAPADGKGWKPIKADSLTLAEGGNLLLMRTPDKGAAEWNQHAVLVRELGGKLYRAAKKRDYAAAQTHYKAMLVSCNACHKTFADGKYQLKP